ncbi:uncharacterized protein LOC122668477 [Telopea speciosissima]|uniref:uncharacterized protein LOC122668477 n=1 Tax=Telopea speciosissima TaxID=54955 RepID=UPI001CC70C0A|nr:uncharacterized protein LOC122668477 [Telopea speciosissima]
MVNNQFSLPMLNGDNYVDWKEKTELALMCMDYDLTLREDKPAPLKDTSIPAEISHFKDWERSNRISLSIINAHIHKSIKGSIPDCDTVKEYMKEIDAQFMSSDKAIAMTLIGQFSSIKHSASKGVRAHIMHIRDIAAQLKTLKLNISEPFLVYYILNTLPKEFAPFKISFNTHKDEWSFNELQTMCVQEEERLKRESKESVYQTTTLEKGQSSKSTLKKKTWKKPVKKEGIKKASKCFFCKKK